jgi:uncharacterized protein (TIRG00374 family)
VGIAVTLLFVWLTLRDVSFEEVGRTIARADWLVLFGLSVPCYVLLVWFRALRWRYLTDAVQPIATAPLARAVAVGFMANNIFPLRIGEVVRAWYLARETGASTAALFGTVILERMFDAVSILVLVLIVIGIWGAGGGGELARGALWLLPVTLLPIAFLGVLRAAPDRVVRVASILLRPFPARIGAFAERTLRRFGEGLGALRGGRHLVWIAVHSVIVWFVLTTIPVIVAFIALDMDLGDPMQVLGAAWTTQAAVGVAVALPSAPGFFGIFHSACKFALLRFGVDAETAVAAGTLIHGVMWLTLTGMGLAVLRLRRTSLGELDRAAGGPAGESSR